MLPSPTTSQVQYMYSVSLCDTDGTGRAMELRVTSQTKQVDKCRRRMDIGVDISLESHLHIPMRERITNEGLP